MKKRQISNLRESLMGIVGNSPFGIITLSKDLEVCIINSYAIELLGFKNAKPSSKIDKSYKELFANIEDLTYRFEKFNQNYLERHYDLTNIEFDEYVLNIKFRTMLNGTLVIIEDITKQFYLERELLHQATYDDLTELVNRKQFEKRVELVIEKAKTSDLYAAIIFIDLDRFKPINDLAGHSAGDKFLKNIADILKSKVRKKDTLARFGGDEFTVLIENCTIEQASKIAETMREEVEKFVFSYNNKSFNSTLSAGIAPITGVNDTVSSVINAADSACQIAKNDGRNRIHIISTENGELEAHKKEIEWIAKIKDAVASDDFVLYAQKIESINPNIENSHYEVLIRLKAKDGSIIPPNAFIPPAERYNLMPLIDRWVIKEAFSTIDIKNEYAINLSGQTISDDSFIEYIEEMLDVYHIDPFKICFEITETAAIQHINRTITLIDRLKEKGFKFSLDDFGSGLSSFAYLKNMSVDFLKIDGIFVKDIVNDPISYAMVNSINEIGHTMGLKTIAEYVEDQNILDKLKEIGIDYSQGYHVHKPEPLKDILY